MNTRLVFILAFLLISVLGFSQKIKTKKPNYKQIEKEISDKQSIYFYPSLFKRYLVADSTMTLNEKRNVYYGYTFQNDYSPYAHSSYYDSLKLVLKKKQPNNDELSMIINFSDSILAKNPFDLRALNYQLYAYESLQKQEEFNKKIVQMRIIVDALLSSGDGLKKKTAYYVIFTSHEYDLLYILGLEFGGSLSLIEHYDYLKVTQNSKKIEGLYFDVSPCLNSLNSMFN